MQLAVQIIGIIIIIEGISFVLRPDFAQKVIAFFGRGKRLYSVGVLRCIVAVIFLVASSQCNIQLVIMILGILFLVSGIAVFALGLERQKAILSWWQQKSLNVLRLVSVIVLLIGAAIVYSA